YWSSDVCSSDLWAVILRQRTIPRVAGSVAPAPSAPRSGPLWQPSRPGVTRVSTNLPSSLLRQHRQVPTDSAGGGGAPRRATAWETEARSVLLGSARSVNTEGPRP